ncbi:MAG TPA: hypothetical protein VKU41_21745 [Polyangiaceae bacterium]|nr:hypothetical protein [Polyangiaceae bacterium]
MATPQVGTGSNVMSTGCAEEPGGEYASPQQATPARSLTHALASSPGLTATLRRPASGGVGIAPLHRSPPR